ncbi:hypothetical protein ACTMU2_24370 [Cupriavidus basilensis]
MTLTVFLATFACQVGAGFVLDLWPVSDGRTIQEAHLAVWSGLVALQALAAVWYVTRWGAAARARFSKFPAARETVLSRDTDNIPESIGTQQCFFAADPHDLRRIKVPTAYTSRFFCSRSS